MSVYTPVKYQVRGVTPGAPPGARSGTWKKEPDLIKGNIDHAPRSERIDKMGYEIAIDANDMT